MPLIVMCGFPSSGKTRRAHEIKEHLEKSTERKVHVVGDASMCIDKNSVYAGKSTATWTPGRDPGGRMEHQICL